jgi:hypothetical protein
MSVERITPADLSVAAMALTPAPLGRLTTVDRLRALQDPGA